MVARRRSEFVVSLAQKPKPLEEFILSCPSLCRSPGAEFRAGSRLVIPDDRVGRPLVLSAGSLRAAAAAGDPAACSLPGVLAGATGRETAGAGASVLPSPTRKTAPSDPPPSLRS